MQCSKCEKEGAEMIWGGYYLCDICLKEATSWGATLKSCFLCLVITSGSLAAMTIIVRWHEIIEWLCS